MPFPLPWFDNKVDPLLPYEQNIKPFLYAWDDYQTYDVLWYIPSNLRIYQPFYHSLREYLPLSTEQSLTLSVSDDNPCVVFFDRFTPWNYAWAEGYSTKMFELIKKHCFPFFSGFNSVIFEPKIEITFPIDKFDVQFDYLHKLKKTQYKLSFSCTLSQPQSVVITWLEFQIYGRGSETIKRYQLFQLKEGKNDVVLKFKEYVCACSLVVSGGEEVDLVEQAIEKSDKGILYKNLDKLIEEIDDYFEYIKKEVPIGTIPFDPVQEEVKISYTALPKWYFYASLIYANNNHWGNTINIEIDTDLGKPIFSTPVFNEPNKMTDVFFNLWGNYTLCLIGNYVGRSLPLASGTGNITRNFLDFWKIYQTNLYQQLGLTDPDKAYDFTDPTFENQKTYYKIFQAELYKENLEEALISIGEALPRNVVLMFIDARKKLELQKDAR
ncbi:MAG: hypothetical protein ACRC2R_25965 [Xenococcaceae cyanobacterium]